MAEGREKVIVVHTGALGDSVLLWPMIGSLVSRGVRVNLVTHDSKGRLAARFLGVEWESIERACWRELWTARRGGGADCEPSRRPAGVTSRGVSRVISFVADGPGGDWVRSASIEFPGAAIEVVERRLDRRLAIELAQREGGAGRSIPIRRVPHGPLLVHVGAGSEAKRWPLAQWERVVAESSGAVRVIAGEVERDRFTQVDRAAFDRLGGVFLEGLDALADELLAARVFVGCDSGPSHLAAQLGVPTVAVFTTTESEAWGPIGPAVRVVGGPGVAPGSMEVLAAIGRLVDEHALAATGASGR